MKNETITHDYDVVIVGGGYCGTLVAVHLVRARQGLRIALIERGKAAGRGVAYGTGDPKHLLNVQADQMGAFPDDIGHFYRWLQNHPRNLAAAGITDLRPDAFIPRLVFGDYIQDLLQEARRNDHRLEIIHDEIVDMTRQDTGTFQLLSREGRRLQSAQVVLALGNFPPGESDKTKTWFTNNPYAAEIHAQLAQPGDVLVIGTGLTSLDILLTLAPIKHEGKIHLLSRGGLFPQPHRPSAPYPPFLHSDDLPKTARGLFRRVRKEVRLAVSKGIDWRPVLDAIRPFNQEIWQGLNQDEQKRFLRHIRALWDTHRHRCAPEIIAVKERLEKEGRLICHRGHIRGYRPVGDQIEVTYRPRGATETKTFTVRQVLSCTGPQSDYRKLDDPLVRHLLEHDLLAPDPLKIGAYTGDGGLIRNQSGAAVDGLYTLGSTQKGRLYESIAVPELRGQAATLATRILAEHVTRSPLLTVQRTNSTAIPL
jgi:uncharacterized NAD(P)/FAD-binding protein YdhS